MLWGAMARPSTLFIALLACCTAPILSGCAQDGRRYPSLAVRPAERAFATATPRRDDSPVPPAPDAALLTQIADLRQRAQVAAAAFAGAADKAERLTTAARGTSLGSEAWAAATVAMAGLDSARSDTALPLAELDSLRVARAVQDAGALGQDDPLAQADAAVAAMVQDEDARIARLRQDFPG